MLPNAMCMRVQMAGTKGVDTSAAAATALLAIAALISNNQAAQRSFIKQGGLHVVSGILCAGTCSARMQRRAIALALDLSQQAAQAQV